MKWRWTEQERRAEWEKWKTQGKAAYLWRVGMLRLALPWGTVMLIYFLFLDPNTRELRSLPFISFLKVFAVFVIISVMFGLFTGFITWWQMRKKYG